MQKLFLSPGDFVADNVTDTIKLHKRILDTQYKHKHDFYAQ